jgi:hypothetical protein
MLRERSLSCNCGCGPTPSGPTRGNGTMAIIVAQPHTWTLLGIGPLRIFPKSWRLGLIMSTAFPDPDDPPEEILLPNRGQNYNVTVPIFAKPLDGVITAVGVSQIAPLPGTNGAGDADVGSVLVPVNLIPPSIVGSPTIGAILSVNLGIWTNSPTSYSYQILRDGSAVPGAGGVVTSPGVTYTVNAADSGTALTVNSAASNDFGVGGPTISAGLSID